MTGKKKFFVGKGKAVRTPAPQAHETNGSSAASPRRFLVGDGTKLPVRAPEPVTPLRYGVPVRANGCICARPERTGHVPFCPHYAEALYVCETADYETVKSLAKLANSSVAELEARRLGYMDHSKDECREVLDDEMGPRRRCWTCPFWNRHKDDNMGTPIQLAYEEVR